MRFLRKLLACFLIYITMSLAVMGAFMVGILSTYLSPEFYKTDFFKQVIYEEIIDQVSETIDQKFQKEQIRNLIPPDVLSKIINDIFNQIESDGIPQSLVIPLAIDQSTPTEFKIPIGELTAQMSEKQQKMLSYALSNGRAQLPMIFLSIIIILIVMIFFLAGKPFWKATLWIGTTLLLDGAFIFAGIYSIKKFGTLFLENAEVNPELITPIINEMHLYALLLIAGAAIGYTIGIGIFYKTRNERT